MPMFVIGVATTVLVIIPWLTNLVAKPLATAFGGSLVAVGLVVAFVTYTLERRGGRHVIFPYLHRPEHPLVLLRGGRRLARAAVLAVLPHDPKSTSGVIAKAVTAAQGRPVTFSYTGDKSRSRRPSFLEILDPYADDDDAHEAFQLAAAAARENHIQARYVYVPAGTESDVEHRLREELNPDVVIRS